ncbi:MAG: Obg family GTPase CgtA, partial [Oscillospiraceae bacterium]|nr:Obg family GTPase CgtA [Oscillospiraceae bacterium]
VTTKGTRELMQIVSEELSKLPPVKIFEAQPLTLADWETKLSSRQEFEIEIEDNIYYISAPWLAPILRTVNMQDYSSLQYFQRVLRSSGIIDKLEELGIQEGDTVNIFGFEFDYIR